MDVVRQAVRADVVARVDAAACYDDKHGNDADNDARYDRHVHDAEPVDAARQAVREDGVVPADVVAPGRMHICLLADKIMRICIFS